MRYSLLCLPALVLLGFAHSPLHAASYPAQVVRVVDGDTVILKWDNQEGRVRIIGIDTPETVDPRRAVECFGEEASARAHSLLATSSQVSLLFDDEYDKYHRALGYISLGDGRDFGKQMISEGYAYAYRSFDHDRLGDYVQTEREARRAQLGLWATDACPNNTRLHSTIEVSQDEYRLLIEKIIRFLLKQLF